MEIFFKTQIKTQIKGQGDPTAGPYMLLASVWPKRLRRKYVAGQLVFSSDWA